MTAQIRKDHPKYYVAGMFGKIIEQTKTQVLLKIENFNNLGFNFWIMLKAEDVQ